MAQSNTTDRLYYFARRKDTGMAGVWFTHCASEADQQSIAYQLMFRAEFNRHRVVKRANRLNSQFPVGFLMDNFVAVVKYHCQNRGISIAADLTMAVLRENGVHNIEKLP